MSEWPWKAQSVAEVGSYKGDEVWSGDASLQQTSVLGPGDGCGAKPEGNTNKIQGVVADCCKGRPGSGGSSLASMSHLQSSGGTSSVSVLPQTSAHSQPNKEHLSSQAACGPHEKTSFNGQFGCGDTDESGCLEETSGVCGTETAPAAVQNSRLSSLVSKVSWFAQDAVRLLWSSAAVLQQVREKGLQPVGACWTSHFVSLVRDSKVLSRVKSSQVLTTVKGSFIFASLKDSTIFSVVKDLPLIQRIHMEFILNLQSEEGAQVQDCTATQPPRYVKQAAKQVTQLLPVQDCGEPEVPHESQHFESSRTVHNRMDIRISRQTLIEFPDFLLRLQTAPLPELLDTLQSVISTLLLTPQKIVAVYWLSVAKCSHPKPCPALLTLAETGLLTLTSNSGPLVLFHYLPLFQLKEVHITLAGHSLRLMGATEESILGVYTHSEKLTKELCRAMLSIMHPGDPRVSQHPLLHGDLLKMSLDWESHVPDLLLDAGLRVCCQFQKSLADLIYLLHQNMDHEMVSLGEVHLRLYTTVGVRLSTCREAVAKLILTDTHIGLVQEDAVFYPTACSFPIVPCGPQFHDLTLRQCSDVRCVLVHDEDESGAVGLDVILANVRARGHPESVTKTATPSAHISNSSLHAEMWKLTFSGSSEAACLINHLSNV